MTVRFDMLPEEAAYTAAITIHCPNCDEMEMASRVDIAMMRDSSARAAVTASESAAVLLNEVAKIATYTVYAPLSVSDLLRVRFALGLTMEAARGLERVC